MVSIWCPCICPPVLLSARRSVLQIFTKHSMCINVMDNWLVIVNGQFRQLLTELSDHDTRTAGYYRFAFSFISTRINQTEIAFLFCIYTSKESSIDHFHIVVRMRQTVQVSLESALSQRDNNRGAIVISLHIRIEVSEIIDANISI